MPKTKSEKKKVQKATESNKNNKRSSETKTVTSQKDEQRNDLKTPAVNPVLPPNQNSYAKIVGTFANKQEVIVVPSTIKPKINTVNHYVSFCINLNLFKP